MIKMSGVCRHRCLLFKFVCDAMCDSPSEWATGVDAKTADSLAIRCALIRGGLDRDNNLHVWLLVRTYGDDRKERVEILDLMNGREGKPYSLFSIDSNAAKRFLPATPIPVGSLFFCGECGVLLFLLACIEDGIVCARACVYVVIGR
jgi:hypothetical protein